MTSRSLPRRFAGRAKRALLRLWRAVQRWLDQARGTERIHFLHIGKTGGTAVKAALEEAQVPGKRFLLWSHEVRVADVPHGEKMFFFVRDPVSRFVSGFYSRQRQGRPRYHYPWSADEEKAFDRFDTANALALALSSPDQERRAAAVHAMRSIVHVRDSYWKWMGSEDELRSRRPDILFVGSQEHLARDAALLSERIGVAIALPADEVGSHRTPGNLPTRLEPESVANLREWYAEDYRCLALLAEWFGHLPEYGGSGGDKSPLGR